jgi:mannose-6-phosphate isomerase-like protein (cupin superfamily)
MDPQHFDLVVVLSGSGVLQTRDFGFPCEQGECWFLPANLNQYLFQTREPATFIRTYVPNIPVLREELRRAAQDVPAHSMATNRTIFD